MEVVYLGGHDIDINGRVFPISQLALAALLGDQDEFLANFAVVLRLGGTRCPFSDGGIDYRWGLEAAVPRSRCRP